MPRARSRADDDDDRPRRPVREAAEEVRPSRRRRARDDDRPARRKSITPARILGVSIGLFVLAVAVVTIVLVAGRVAKKPAATDLAAHVPSDAVVLSGFDFNELSQYEPYRKALDRRPPPDLVELDKAGVRTAELARVLIARTPSNGNTCVIRFKAGPERSRYLGPDLPGKVYAPFTSLSGNYKVGYFPDPSTLVLADTERAIEAILVKGPTARLSAGLQVMVDKAHGPAWRATGRVTEAEHGGLGTAESGFSIQAGASAGTAAWIEPDGRLATVRLVLEFDNANQARSGAAALKGLFNQQKVQINGAGQFAARPGLDPADLADLQKGYNEAEVNDSGSRVTARVRLPAVEALRAIGSVRY
jgi:hypothetical protein